jgi:hypothetical protein
VSRAAQPRLGATIRDGSVEFFQTRRRLWAVAGLWTGVLLSAFNLYAAFVTYIPQYRVRNDFRLMYGAALNAWQHG